MRLSKGRGGQSQKERYDNKRGKGMRQLHRIRLAPITYLECALCGIFLRNQNMQKEMPLFK